MFFELRGLQPNSVSTFMNRLLCSGLTLTLSLYYMHDQIPPKHVIAEAHDRSRLTRPETLMLKSLQPISIGDHRDEYNANSVDMYAVYLVLIRRPELKDCTEA